MTNENKVIEIKPIDFFYTPKSMDELMKKIEQLNGSERSIAMSYAMFAWNLACHLTNEK